MDQRFFATLRLRVAVFFRDPLARDRAGSLAVAAGDVLRARVFAPFVAFAVTRGLPNRFVASSSCRCNVPITRPRDSADRNSSESSSRDRSRGFRAGSVFLRLAIHSSFGPVARCAVVSKECASRIRFEIESFCP
jgi:hypothetical protein